MLRTSAFAVLAAGAAACAGQSAAWAGIVIIVSSAKMAAAVADFRIVVFMAFVLVVTERADGGTRVSYPLPSAVFRPYGNARIDAMAQELDPIFERIVRDATAE